MAAIEVSMLVGIATRQVLNRLTVLGCRVIVRQSELHGRDCLVSGTRGETLQVVAPPTLTCHYG